MSIAARNGLGGQVLTWPGSCIVPECTLSPERVQVSSESTRSRLAMRYAQRCEQASKVLGVIVYDSDLLPERHGNAYDGNFSQTEWLGQTWWKCEGDMDTTLVFESRFESGNLRRAIRVFADEYDLILRPDVNTSGHAQWFFFSIKNTRKGAVYKFNIINMAKAASLYSDGMRPLVHSKHRAVQMGSGWGRAGFDVAYFLSSVKSKKSGRPYAVLTFSIRSQYDHDHLLCCHSYPYTYSELQSYLQCQLGTCHHGVSIKRTLLCYTMAAHRCDLLTITSNSTVKEKQAVVLMARVHPGESMSSYMMRGALDFLLCGCTEAHQLLERFIFKVIPMLNPDGVVVGNTRCNMSGLDLNRCWSQPSHKYATEVHAAKKAIQQVCKEFECYLLMDFHGHSRKHGMFLYGCCKDDSRQFSNEGLLDNPRDTFLPPEEMSEKERLLPWLLAKNAPQLFSLGTCNFNVKKAKENTCRVVGWRELGLRNRCCFCGKVHLCCGKAYVRHLR